MLEVLAVGAILKKLVEKAGETEEGQGPARFVFDKQAVGSIVQQTKEFVRGEHGDDARHAAYGVYSWSAGLRRADCPPSRRRPAHKVATITEQEAGATADAIGTVYNLAQNQLTGSSIDKFNRIGDVLAEMQGRFEIKSVDSLKESFAALLPLTQALNVPLSSTAALIGVLSRGGQDPAGAALIMRNLEKAKGELGFKIKLDSSGNTDLAGTMRNMVAQVAATHGGDFANGSADVQKAFGGRAFRVIEYLVKNTDLLAESQNQLANSTGRLNSKYKEVEEGAKGMLSKIGRTSSLC